MTRFRGIQTGSDMFKQTLLSLHEKSIEITFTYSPLRFDKIKYKIRFKII